MSCREPEQKQRTIQETTVVVAMRDVAAFNKGVDGGWRDVAES